MGPRRIPQNSHEIARKISLQKFRKINRRASAGAQGEGILFFVMVSFGLILGLEATGWGGGPPHEGVLAEDRQGKGAQRLNFFKRKVQAR